MKKMWLGIFVCTLFLTGCGSNDENNKETEATNTTTAKDTLSTTVKSDKEYPYTYTDAAGREITITAEIKCIAVDYLPLWESLMLLGIKPVAASGADNYIATWDAFAGYDVSGVIDIGQGEVNLEALAAQEPDLILTQTADVNNLDIANYEQLGNVAVFDNATKMDWKLSLREVGALLGLEEKAEKVISEIEEQLNDSKERLSKDYKDQTIMQITIMAKDKFYIANRPELFSDEGLGLKTPEGYTTSSKYEQVSMEAIAQMNPDYIFLNVFDGDEAIYDGMKENSVWKSLNAVKNNNVYIIDGSGHAASALSTQYTVNFIIDTLLEK